MEVQEVMPLLEIYKLLTFAPEDKESSLDVRKKVDEIKSITLDKLKELLNK